MRQPQSALAQEARHRLRHAARHGQHGLAPEAAVGLHEIGECIIAGNAEQHRRHAKGECNLARRAILGGAVFHVLGAVAHFLPVEPAFQHHGPPGIGRPLVAVLQLFLQPLELLARQVPIRRRIDQRARRPGGIVQHRLVPAARRIVRVDGALRRFQGRHAVVVVQRVEQPQLQHIVARQPHRLSVDGIIIGLGPAIIGSNRLHPIRSKCVELPHRAVDFNLLDIGIPRHQQEAVELLAEFAAWLPWIGFLQQLQQRMRGDLAVAVIQKPRQRPRRLRNHPHGAVSDGIGGKPLLGECRIIPRRPLRPSCLMQRNQRGGGGALGFGGKETSYAFKHDKPSINWRHPGEGRDPAVLPHRRRPKGDPGLRRGDATMGQALERPHPWLRPPPQHQVAHRPDQRIQPVRALHSLAQRAAHFVFQLGKRTDVPHPALLI